jgi:hypothetical protein
MDGQGKIKRCKMFISELCDSRTSIITAGPVGIMAFWGVPPCEYPCYNEIVVTARGAQAFLRVLIFVYIVTFAKGQMRCNHHWIMKG